MPDKNLKEQLHDILAQDFRYSDDEVNEKEIARVVDQLLELFNEREKEIIGEDYKLLENPIGKLVYGRGDGETANRVKGNNINLEHAQQRYIARKLLK